ncbi:hypothetical protein [Kitasatospora sp. LaBMicrA B282]|uniref:hypothetical protein n=1 Tax=Kitasatospora sp. LaBMicrA B282 TaxID=3420949 RepID=UPI003D0FEC6C
MALMAPAAQSAPILRRLGLLPLTTATRYVWTPPALPWTPPGLPRAGEPASTG